MRSWDKRVKRTCGRGYAALHCAALDNRDSPIMAAAVALAPRQLPGPATMPGGPHPAERQSWRLSSKNMDEQRPWLIIRKAQASPRSRLASLSRYTGGWAEGFAAAFARFCK